MPVNGTIRLSTFEWIIPKFREILRRRDGDIQSPDFQLQNSRWFLELSCSYDDEGRYSIALWKNFRAPKTVAYTIRIHLRTHVKEFNETAYFGGGGIICREIFYFCIKDVESYSNLLITCYINCDTPHPVAGKDSVNCAVENEVANTVIEKEKPKNEELSSLDIKDDELLRERMKKLLTKGTDHDVTICVQDKEFRAHRNILSARSPVFAMMLSHDTKENNTGTIRIEDCDPESFDEFLLYVYSGRTENLTPSNALQLYYSADKYDFPVLKERCVSLLKTSLSVQSICDVVLLAAKHQEKELLDAAAEFFARNMKKILVTVAWQKFLPQNSVEANELIIKSMEILHPEE